MKGCDGHEVRFKPVVINPTINALRNVEEYQMGTETDATISAKDRRFDTLQCYGKDGRGFFESDYSRSGSRSISGIAVDGGDDLVRKSQFITDSKSATIMDLTEHPYIASRNGAVSVTDGVIDIQEVDDGKMVTVISGYPLVDEDGKVIEPWQVIKFTGRKVGMVELGSMKTKFVMFDVDIGPSEPNIIMIATVWAMTAVLDYEDRPEEEDARKDE
jgi:hypothetical protein